MYCNENARGRGWFETTNTNQWASFDMNQKQIFVRIGLVDERGIGKDAKVGVKPAGKGMEVAGRLGDGSMVLHVKNEGQFWICVEGMEMDPLFLFVNQKGVFAGESSKERIVLNVDTDSDYREVFRSAREDFQGISRVVLLFEPGIHYVGFLKDVLRKRGLELYLPYGAVLVGRLKDCDLADFRIRGRGIIDGGHEKMKWPADKKRFEMPKNIEEPAKHHENLTDFAGRGKEFCIEGVTMISTRGFFLRCFLENSRYFNVKLMGWSYNTDGVGIYKNATCENSFFKVNDDCFKTRQWRC